MGELAGWSGKDVIKILERFGYSVIRQRGSHARLRHTDSSHHKPLTIPIHGEMKVGLLRQIISDAGLTVEEFIRK